jgi:hypothetical protein
MFGLDRRIESVQFKTWQVLREEATTWGVSNSANRDPEANASSCRWGTTHFNMLPNIFVLTHGRCWRECSKASQYRTGERGFKCSLTRHRLSIYGH